MTRRALAWAVAALLGLAVTAAMTWSVSRLTREHIGLSAEPRTLLNGLAPPSALPPGRDTGAGASRTTATSPPAGRRPSTGAGSAPVSPTAPTVATPTPPPAPLPAVSPHPSRGDNRDDSGGTSRAGSGPDD